MKQFLELLPTLLAFGIGLFLFQKLSMFLRLLFLQVSIYFFVDSFAIFITDNHWLYNLMMPIEAGLLFYAAEVYFKTIKSKIIIRWLYSFFLVIYFTDIFHFTGLYKLANHAAIAEGFFMTMIYTFLLYKVLMNRGSQKIDMPATLVSLGMVFYFACTVPYLCVILYFQKRGSDYNDPIFSTLIEPLAVIRYLLIAIGFYQVANRKRDFFKPQLK